MNKSQILIQAYENQVTSSININIVDRIGNMEASAFDMRRIVDNALKNGIKKANVFLSSGGGNTFEAEDMILELNKFGNSNVFLTIGALAASAATRFLIEFYENSSCYPQSQFMIHPPEMCTQGTVDQIKSDLRLLENTQNTYRTSYAQAFGKTEEEIEKLWKPAFWMSSVEAQKIKLVKNIIEADIPWDENTIKSLEACGAPKIPNPKPTKPINTMDRNKIIAAAGLAADASDEAIENAIKDLKTKATASDQLKNQLAEAHQVKVKNLVANAVAAKKIKADQVKTYEDLATANYQATETAINSLPAITALSGEINDPKAFNNSPEDRASWTYEDYLEKAPEAYNELLEKDSKKAMEIFNNRRK